jgi:foldase protein PrsA
VRQAASAFGVEVPEALVEARVGQIREQWGGAKSFQNVLKRLGLTENLLRDELRTRLLLDAVRDKILAGVTITDEQTAEYYRQNLAQYVVPESREIRHIVLRTRAEAVRIRAQLTAGANFAALARRYSLDDSTRTAGGRLSVFRGRGDPRLERAAFALRTHQLSGPVKTGLGWHVIEALSNVRPRHTIPYADVQNAIRNFLRLTHANALHRQWVDESKAAWAAKTEYAPGFAPGS